MKLEEEDGAAGEGQRLLRAGLRMVWLREMGARVQGGW